MSNISQWSTTAASNNSTAPDGWPENMAPSGVNDSARENMAAAAKQYQDNDGSLVTTGTGTAYVLATNNSHAALGDIGLTVFRVSTINTGSATLAVDGLVAKTLQIRGVNLNAGDLPQDVLVAVAYNSTNDTFDLLGISRSGLDLNGNELILDADGDTSITADTDDQIDIKIGGSDVLTLTSAKAGNLDDIAALAHSNGNFQVSDGTDWVVESGATARASMGVTIGTDVQAYAAVLQNTTASYTTALDTKLDGVETSADVTDETNVVSSLSGATLTGVTLAGTDKVLLQDVSNSDALRTVTAQSIADLGVTGYVTLSGTPVANDMARFTDGDTVEGRSYAEVKADLSLETGTDVQAWDAQLDDIAALAVTDGNVIVGDGANWVAESGATARTSLGAGTMSNLSEDTTPQLGGDLDCNGAQIQWSQGADVASGAALAVLTDGNYFDVTGTTTITSINTTGGAGTQIKLHFDGALTLTHHATNLILPGGANITTAAGDEAEFMEYGSGTYRCTNYTKASGEPVVASAAGLTLLSTVTASDAATADIETTFDSTYDVYIIEGTDVQTASDSVNILCHRKQTTYGLWDYTMRVDDLAAVTWIRDAASSIVVETATGIGTASSQKAQFTMTIYNPSSSSVGKQANIIGGGQSGYATAPHSIIDVSLFETATAAITGIRFLASSGNINGTFKLYGVTK